MSLSDVLATVYLYAGPAGILAVLIFMLYHIAREAHAAYAHGGGLFREDDVASSDREEEAR
ncbi:MAG: hypothetical protein GX134_09615 [candidate division WS1 bacterium]|jgi:hypothetical protein|nr:hypothetical protein [candidate division WS1 bacterium]